MPHDTTRSRWSHRPGLAMLPGVGLALALLGGGCGPKAAPQPAADFAPLSAREAWRTLIDRRDALTSVRIAGELTIKEQGASDTVQVVIIGVPEEFFLVDLIDPLGRSAVTLRRDREGVWVRSRKRIPIETSFLRMAQRMTPGELTAALIGLPLPGITGQPAEDGTARHSRSAELVQDTDGIRLDHQHLRKEGDLSFDYAGRLEGSDVPREVAISASEGGEIVATLSLVVRKAQLDVPVKEQWRGRDGFERLD